jgi:hypothetical protein
VQLALSLGAYYFSIVERKSHVFLSTALDPPASLSEFIGQNTFVL